MRAFGLRVERLNNGHPILRPNGNWWESGVTFNPAAVLLERSEANDPIIAGLIGSGISLNDERVRDGVVAVHYRARPLKDPGCAWNRSFIGLAVYTPTLQLLRRFDGPVLKPNEDPSSVDNLGAEDPRITRIGDVFYMVYCGVAPVLRSAATDGDGNFDVEATLCIAKSRDLINWERILLSPGDLQVANNKDGALFPDKSNGYYWLLHRAVDPADDTIKAMRLARSRHIAGPWEECGVILSATPNPNVRRCWVGAGSVPIALDQPGKFLLLYHTGNWLTEKDREYDVDAAIVDLSRWSADNPGDVVLHRIDRLMVPETDYEFAAPVADSVGNVLFPCGSYEYRGDLYIIYGAADTYVMASKVHKRQLLDALAATAPDGTPATSGDGGSRAKVTVSVPAAAQTSALAR